MRMQIYKCDESGTEKKETNRCFVARLDRKETILQLFSKITTLDLCRGGCVSKAVQTYVELVFDQCDITVAVIAAVTAAVSAAVTALSLHFLP